MTSLKLLKGDNTCFVQRNGKAHVYFQQSSMENILVCQNEKDVHGCPSVACF